MCEERNANSIQFGSQAASSFGSMTLEDKDDQSKFNQGASQDWIEQDQLFEICQSLNVHDWQDVYTTMDVETLFENFVVELNHKQVRSVNDEDTMQISPISSGVHIGSSNWMITVQGEGEQQRYGLLTNICLEGEYRYPKSADPAPFQNVDCLLLSSTIIDEQAVRKNLDSTYTMMGQ